MRPGSLAFAFFAASVLAIALPELRASGLPVLTLAVGIACALAAIVEEWSR